MFFSYCFKNKYGLLNIIYTILSILTTVNFVLMGMASDQKISSLQESQNNLYFVRKHISFNPLVRRFLRLYLEIPQQ